jgi:hypothetical protein
MILCVYMLSIYVHVLQKGNTYTNTEERLDLSNYLKSDIKF